MADDRAAWESWRAARAQALSAPDSWLGVIGLFWLEEGRNTVGADAASTVVLPDGPALLGTLDCSGGSVVWRPTAGAAARLQTDAGGAPTVIEHDGLAFFVIERDGRLAVRVRDHAWALRQPFAGIDCYPHDPAWRVEASWQPLASPRIMEVPNVSGDLKAVSVAWQAVFERAGTTVTLLPMSVSAAGVFFVFRDASSGRETYGAGRFLNAAAPEGGLIVLDFNRAFNPPCAFTAFATCPLPPPENWLPFAVPAGEKRYRA